MPDWLAVATGGRDPTCQSPTEPTRPAPSSLTGGSTRRWGSRRSFCSSIRRLDTPSRATSRLSRRLKSLVSGFNWVHPVPGRDHIAGVLAHSRTTYGAGRDAVGGRRCCRAVRRSVAGGGRAGARFGRVADHRHSSVPHDSEQVRISCMDAGSLRRPCPRGRT